MTQSVRSVCVFCGSRDGASPSFRAAATELGRLIGAEGWRLVYGAGDVGLMGAVAQAAQDAGAATFGVIPVHLLNRERQRPVRRTLEPDATVAAAQALATPATAHPDRATLVITEDMHERKKVMFMNSDAIVVLPGGAGSLDEFFEVLTWRQIGLHQRPVHLLNTDGYWTPLLALIDHTVAQGFAEPGLRDFIRSLPDVAALAKDLRAALA